MKKWFTKAGSAIYKYNCGNMSDVSFIMFFWFVLALFAISIASVFLQHFSGTELLFKVSACILVLSMLAGVMFIKATAKKEKPYMRMKDYFFLGLYDLSKEDLSGSKDIISRDEEAESIRNVLENVIFSQETVKQALALIGKSGCGKSTILAFFKQKYGEDYEIADFSGNYMYFLTAMEEKFGTNIDEALIRKIKQEKKKIILILDQFERFFFLEDEAKREIRDKIKIFGRKNTAIILSMREEYLSAFLNEFDANNMKAEIKTESRPRGILRELVSVIEDYSDGVQYKNMGSGLLNYKKQDCKNNTYMHLECSARGIHTGIERMGVNIFYCESQNNSKVTVDKQQETSTQMKDKCEKVFGAEEGKKFYDKHKKDPLIEQQILFHMAEFEQKENGIPTYKLEGFCKKENNMLLNEYFERQIAACKDTFDALRVLYLLSSARLNHVSMNKTYLQEGLFECQFNEEGGKILNETLDKLQELQLIRKSIEDSDIEYEIAHDFIAASFINYSNARIGRHVKNALDLYMANYLNGRQKEQIDQRRIFNKQAYYDAYYKRMSILSMVIVVIIYIIERFIYNPFDTVWRWLDPYGEMFLFAPIINLISIWYLCRIYDKFVKFYRGKKALLCKILYIPIMLTAIGGVLFYPHVLGFDGASLGMMGVNVAFLLRTDTYYETGKRELFSYGLKCAVMGSAYAVFHIIFAAGYQDGFSFLIIALETTVLWLLVVYAQLAHMTKDFLYARRMDVTCEKM